MCLCVSDLFGTLLVLSLITFRILVNKLGPISGQMSLLPIHIVVTKHGLLLVVYFT